jgi:glutamine amidotransferase
MVKLPRIAIIDYRMSNMFSIKNALDLLGFESEVTSDHKKIVSADGAILPGVGSFAEAMKHINAMGLAGPIIEFISSGKLFMGICLGLQLLFSESEEFGYTSGLGIIEGKVGSLERHDGIRRVPHVGWNCVQKRASIENNAIVSSFDSIVSGEYFYFVHSYYVNPVNDCDVYTTTEYSEFEFCSSILKGNVFASQFHPEKSGEAGLKVLRDFFNK